LQAAPDQAAAGGALKLRRKSINMATLAGTWGELRYLALSTQRTVDYWEGE